MYARTRCAVIRRVVYVHPTVAELISTMLADSTRRSEPASQAMFARYFNVTTRSNTTAS